MAAKSIEYVEFVAVVTSIVRLQGIEKSLGLVTKSTVDLAHCDVSTYVFCDYMSGMNLTTIGIFLGHSTGLELSVEAIMVSNDEFGAFTVLVVEDEVFSQRVVTRLLSAVGVGQVLTANNGDEALKVLESDDDSIDLIISDIEMPGMDGFELTRKIRYGVVPHYKEVPILMLTGHDTDKNVRKGRIHRIDGFVVKPLSQDVLIQHLRQMLDL